MPSERVAELVGEFAKEWLQSYRSELSAPLDTIAHGWLPDESDPGVKEHLETLQDYLARNDLVEHDSFLLRSALTAPGRRKCVTPPIALLEEDRGGFKSLYLHQAKVQVTKLREALAIGQYLRGDLPSDTERAIHQIADIASSPRAPSDDEVLDQFAQLGDAEVDELTRVCVECLDSPTRALREMGAWLLHRLACNRFEPLQETTCRQLIERSVFWPHSLYRDSGNNVARLLLAELDRATKESRMFDLWTCLAWTRLDVAVQAYLQRKDVPRLRFPAVQLPRTFDAGWYIDEAGARRDLILAPCLRLVSQASATGDVIPCRVPLPEKCPACRKPQTILFDLSGQDALRVGLLDDIPRRIVTCLYCGSFETVFTRYEGERLVEWISPRKRAPYARGESFPLFKTSYRAIATVPRPPCAGGLQDNSTLGGFPCWRQHAAYPRCPGCQNFMLFVAQHDNSALREEGTYFLMFCRECHIAAVTYQQT